MTGYGWLALWTPYSTLASCKSVTMLHYMMCRGMSMGMDAKLRKSEKGLYGTRFSGRHSRGPKCSSKSQEGPSVQHMTNVQRVS